MFKYNKSKSKVRKIKIPKIFIEGGAMTEWSNRNGRIRKSTCKVGPGENTDLVGI